MMVSSVIYKQQNSSGLLLSVAAMGVCKYDIWSAYGIMSICTVGPLTGEAKV